MLRYTLKRLFYGILVLLGVVTLVFFLFNILPGDPARMMLGERADEESIAIINRDLGRDKPVGLQYINYLNDLLPISLHNNLDPDNYFFLDEDKYAPYTTLLKAGSTSVVLKAPYLRRSYQSKRKVSDIIATAFPQTALLAVHPFSLVQRHVDRPHYSCALHPRHVAALFLCRHLDSVAICLCPVRLDSPQYVRQPLHR